MPKDIATEKIISLIFNIGRSIHKQANEESREVDKLSFLQIETLRHIRENKKVLMKNLAAHLFITPPSATSIVDELVEAKLVKRSEDRKDRRVVAISLAPKGRRALKNALQKKMERIRKRIDLLTQREKSNFLKILEKISKING